MANFIPPSTITADGDYEINTRFSRKHLLTLKGTFDTATVTMTTFNDADGTWTAVNNGSFTATTEFTFDAPSDRIRLNVASASGSTEILVTLTPLFAR
jgi:hypothetical protein